MQWRLAEELRPTLMGVGPALLMACRKAGVSLRERDLSSIRQLCAAGSPLAPEGYDWVYEQLGPQVLLNVGSGGTDVCTGIVQGGPLQPVFRGEISGCALGVDVAAFDSAGNPVVGELGELVIRAPMPSMPVGFWNDPDGSRYRATYFEDYPGVWRHGDWITFTPRGSCLIAGRSDATLNRGGVRLGTGEFYPVIEALEEVARQPRRASRGPRRRPRRADPVRRARRRRQLRRGAAHADRHGAARRALAAARARHRRGRAGDPAHADREEARAAGQADPARRAGRRGGQPRRARRSARARRVRRIRRSTPRHRRRRGRPASAAEPSNRTSRARQPAEPRPNSGRVTRQHSGPEPRHPAEPRPNPGRARRLQPSAPSACSRIAFASGAAVVPPAPSWGSSTATTKRGWISGAKATNQASVS